MKTKISKNFLKGFVRTLDLSGTKEWPQLSGDRAKDTAALRSDWKSVGDSIRGEMRNCRQV